MPPTTLPTDGPPPRPSAPTDALARLLRGGIDDHEVWLLSWLPGPGTELHDHDLRVDVLCQAGYTSSLAAAALRDVGVHRATDMVGGFEA